MRHADLSQRAEAATASLPWTSCAGVQEKVLEDAGACRTSLVQLPARGVLPVIGTTGCIDVLVLEGTLRDQRLLYRPGSFLHEPASARRLFTDEGCTLFMKQRPASGAPPVALNTNVLSTELAKFPGTVHTPLVEHDDGGVVLMHFPPGTLIGAHTHHRGEEHFVLAGEFRDELGVYAVHHWIRQPPGSTHSVTSASGCLLLTFVDHLGP